MTDPVDFRPGRPTPGTERNTEEHQDEKVARNVLIKSHSIAKSRAARAANKVHGRFKWKADLHQDKVAAEIKEKELAKLRGDPNRLAQASAERLEAAKQKVVSTETSAQAQDNPSGRPGFTRQGVRVGKSGRLTEADEVEVRLEALLGELCGIIAEIETGGLDTLMKELESDPEAVHNRPASGPMAQRLAKINRLIKRMRETEQQAKSALQMVLTGNTGVKLLNSPELTFKALFDRIDPWPSRIPPSHRPKTAEDFNALIAWAFAPPKMQELAPPSPSV